MIEGTPPSLRTQSPLNVCRLLERIAGFLVGGLRKMKVQGSRFRVEGEKGDFRNSGYLLSTC